MSVSENKQFSQKTMKDTMNYLLGRFPGKLISKRVNISWTLRPPDLAINKFISLRQGKRKVHP